MKNIAKYIFLLAALAVSSLAQETFRDRGIDLYKQEKYKEAADALQQAVKQNILKTDAELWNYLGLSYLKQEKNKEAANAFEKAVKLDAQKTSYHTNLGYAYLLIRKIDKAQSEFNEALKLKPDNALAYFLRGVSNLWERNFDSAIADADQAILYDPLSPDGYILKADVLSAKFGEKLGKDFKPGQEIEFLETAVLTLEAGAAQVKNHPKAEELNEKSETLKVFRDYFNRDRSGILTPPEPGVTQLKIIKKSHPSYTDKARQANISGTIRLAVLFGASGRIEQILPLNWLGYGLDQEVMKAARKIKFEPRIKDGKPVSTVRVVEYAFSIF